MTTLEDRLQTLSMELYTRMLPTPEEKLRNAEVGTPYDLRNEMLNAVPDCVWANKYAKVLEPCCGKGGFLLDIIRKFMVGLRSEIENEEERYNWIVEHCLYWGDINPANTAFCSTLLGVKSNGYTGDMLKLDIEDEWHVKKFDLVVGNPPYNNPSGPGTGSVLWHKFVRKYIETTRYLCMVHPPSWRKPESKHSTLRGLFKKMAHENHMLILNINHEKVGKKVFQCLTPFDWYVIDCVSAELPTIVNDENGMESVLNLQEWPFLPNYHFDVIKEMLDGSDTSRILYSAYYDPRRSHVIFNRRNYGSDQPYVSHNQNEEFKYPLIHSVNLSGIRYCWSSRNDLGHFGVSKVIFSESGLRRVVIDLEGKYGMTQHAMAIPIQTEEDALELEAFLLSPPFKEILRACSWSSYRVDWRLFTYFKDKFWQKTIL